MKWRLLVERNPLIGSRAFFNTGITFEADDPHAYVTELGLKDGKSYAAEAIVPQTLLQRLKKLVGR